MRQVRALLWIALAIASARLVWIGLIRHDSLQRWTQNAANRYMPTPDLGTGLKITQFYPRSTEIIEGDQGLICYGVRDASRVWLDPPVEHLTPALTRCFFVEPHEDTGYTLTAEDTEGRRVTESIQIRVRPAPAEIRMLAVSDREVVRGEAATICYGVAHATTVRLEPIGWQLPPSKDCVRFYPSTTMKYRLVATGVDGKSDRLSFSVAVK